MGRHEITSRTDHLSVAPTAIRYSLAKKLAVAEDIKAGFSLNQVCARHGIAKSTASYIKNDHELMDMLDPDLVERRRKSMAAIYEYQADMALSTLTPERWDKERAASVMTAAAIATDKARLLRGESTDNVSIRGVVDSFSSELVELKKKREHLFSTVQQNGLDGKEGSESAKNEAEALPEPDNSPSESV